MTPGKWENKKLSSVLINIFVWYNCIGRHIWMSFKGIIDSLRKLFSVFNLVIDNLFPSLRVTLLKALRVISPVFLFFHKTIESLLLKLKIPSFSKLLKLMGSKVNAFVPCHLRKEREYTIAIWCSRARALTMVRFCLNTHSVKTIKLFNLLYLIFGRISNFRNKFSV